MVIDPRGLSFERWSALSAPLLNQYGFVPTQGREEDWKTWAMAVKALPQFGSVSLPSPGLYDNWQDWAARFYETALRNGL